MLLFRSGNGGRSLEALGDNASCKDFQVHMQKTRILLQSNSSTNPPSTQSHELNLHDANTSCCPSHFYVFASSAMHGYAVSTISRTSPGRFPDAGIRFVNVRNSILAGLAALPLLHLPALYQPRKFADGAHSPRSLQRLLAGSRARYPLPLVISMPSRAGG